MRHIRRRQDNHEIHPEKFLHVHLFWLADSQILQCFCRLKLHCNTPTFLKLMWIFCHLREVPAGWFHLRKQYFRTAEFHAFY